MGGGAGLFVGGLVGLSTGTVRGVTMLRKDGLKQILLNLSADCFKANLFSVDCFKTILFIE